MEDGESVVRIERKSSIESEPRTLKVDKIQYAREAALYVVNTRSIEEAMNIFTKGLKPVVSVARQNGDAVMDLSSKFLEDQLQLPRARDIASAPF